VRVKNDCLNFPESVRTHGKVAFVAVIRRHRGADHTSKGTNEAIVRSDLLVDEWAYFRMSLLDFLGHLDQYLTHFLLFELKLLLIRHLG